MEWLPELGPVLRSCVNKARAWRLLPNWSATDWAEHVKALAEYSSWEAVKTYDASRGVPLSAFLRQRVIASVRTQYRREWRYGLRHIPAAAGAGYEERASDHIGGNNLGGLLQAALLQLPESDRWIIQQLFWIGATEAEVARQLGVSQPAINKRKRSIIKKLLTIFQ